MIDANQLPADENTLTVVGKASDVTLEGPDADEFDEIGLVIEEHTGPPFCIENISFKVEASELDFKNENEEEPEEDPDLDTSECMLFVDTPFDESATDAHFDENIMAAFGENAVAANFVDTAIGLPFDETTIKTEPEFEVPVIKQEYVEEEMVQDDGIIPSMYIKQERMDDEFADMEENPAVESNSVGHFEFDDDTMGTTQNENFVPYSRPVYSRRYQYDDEKLYTCLHCPRKLRGKVNLHQHLKTHPEQMHSQKKLYTCTYTCTMCPLTFPNLKRLNTHLKDHKVEKPYSCNLCPEKFRVKRDLKDHLELHTYTFACPRCPAKFSQETNLRTHVRVHHERPLTMSIMKSTINSASLVQAMKLNFQSFELEIYNCSKCPAKFKLQSDLSDHQKKVHTDPLQCSQCPAKFTHRDNLHLHMKTHEENPSSSTGISKIEFDLVEEMKRNFQSAEPKMFPCQHCSEKFKKESSLADHLALHFDSSKFQHKCKLCPAKFHKEQTLAQHVILQHHDRKNLKCKLCNETFRLISHLKTHLKMCSKEKPFSCIRCRATFHRKRDMRAHFKAMHPDTIYTCGHCYADFHKKKHIREHMKSHDNLYPCPICPIIFNLEPNLKRHLKQHSEEESSSVGGGRPAVNKILEQKRNYLDDKATMLSCGHCSAKFKEKIDLSHHLKMHYIQPPPEEPKETGLFFKSPFAKEPLPFSLAQEMKKNFANIKLRLSKPM